KIIEVGSHRLDRALGAEIFLEEGKDLLPAVFRLLRPITGAAPVEERMSSAVIAVKFVSLAGFLERLFGAVHLIRIRIFIVVAEQAEERRLEFVGQIDRCDRALAAELRLVINDHVTAPAVDGGIDTIDLGGRQIDMATAGAEADGADLAVAVRLLLEKLDGAFRVAHHLRIGNAAGGARLRANIIGITGAVAKVKVRGDGGIAVM